MARVSAEPGAVVINELRADADALLCLSSGIHEPACAVGDAERALVEDLVDAGKALGLAGGAVNKGIEGGTLGSALLVLREHWTLHDALHRAREEGAVVVNGLSRAEAVQVHVSRGRARGTAHVRPKLRGHACLHTLEQTLVHVLRALLAHIVHAIYQVLAQLARKYRRRLAAAQS